MTTYYLNDPSSNWDVKTNILRSSNNNSLLLQISKPNTLLIQNTNESNPLIYSNASFSSSLGKLTVDTNSISTSIFCYNDIINFVIGSSSNLSMTSNAVAAFSKNPICSQVVSSDSQLVNKLYVDNPIQQATFVKGGSNSITNMSKYISYDYPTMYVSFGYQQGGLLYPTKNINVTGLFSASGRTVTNNGTTNEMWLLSFPDLISNSATVIAKCSNSNFWKAANTIYASNFTEAPFMVTLEKGKKYGIIIYSNSTNTFELRGSVSNFSFFMHGSTYDLQLGGSYVGSTALNIGSTFTFNSAFGFLIPYVGAY